ncbi:MAG: hypothetical protein KC431_27170 [Myxococcales bacterium]|nr:hypothetical protein [Myxococcales bacterium]
MATNKKKPTPVSRKKTARKAAAGKKNDSKQRKPRREFPSRTLKDALMVPEAIERHNSGNPWATEDVAIACKMAKSSNGFFYLTAASRDYGLTEGTRDVAQISMTDLGRSIVLPSSPSERNESLLRAFQNVDLFRKANEHYGDKLPENDMYFDSTAVKEFGVPKEHVDEFREIYKANRDFVVSEGAFNPESKPTNKPEGFTYHKPSSSPDITITVSSHDKTAFVVMPFSEKGKIDRPPGFFQEVLKQIITPAGDQAQFNVATAMQSGSDVIQSTIIERLIHSELIIADLTDHNPNVLFELGVRIALDKPIVLIRAKGTPGIFDVDNLMRVEQYDPLLWVDTIKSDISRISRHIRDGWDLRSTNRRYMEILAGPNWKA